MSHNEDIAFNEIYGKAIEPKSTLNVLHHTDSQRTSESGSSGGKLRLTVTLDILPSTGAFMLSETTLIWYLKQTGFRHMTLLCLKNIPVNGYGRMCPFWSGLPVDPAQKYAAGPVPS